MLRHGIQREVFVCELAKNARRLLATGKGRPNLKELLTVAEVGQLAVHRWMIPRAARRPEFRDWQVEQIVGLLSVKRTQSKIAQMS